MSADNPAARVDLDALTEAVEHVLPLDFEVHESQTIKNAALQDRRMLAENVTRAIADRLAPLLAERNEARESPARQVGAHERTRQSLRRMALRVESLTTERDEALAERDALRERVEDACRHAVTLTHGWANYRSEFVPLVSIRAALADPEASRPLPIHRTEAGYPNCSTCDGGGCPDCTDPA